MALEQGRAVVERFFEGQESFSWERVLVASSHGLVTKRGEQKHKVSFRLIVPGFKMTTAAMKRRLIAVDPRRVFDRQPYGETTQKLRAVGSIKTPEDRRVMHYDGTATAELLESTLVQLVREEDVLIEAAPVGKRGRRPLQDGRGRANRGDRDVQQQVSHRV